MSAGYDTMAFSATANSPALRASPPRPSVRVRTSFRLRSRVRYLVRSPMRRQEWLCTDRDFELLARENQIRITDQKWICSDDIVVAA